MRCSLEMDCESGWVGLGWAEMRCDRDNVYMNDVRKHSRIEQATSYKLEVQSVSQSRSGFPQAA